MANAPHKFISWPIFRKLFVVMLLISLLAVAMILLVSLMLTFNAMQQQLVYNSSMSAEWLQERLEMELEDYTRSFYDLEINRDFRSALLSWCDEGNDLDYESKQDLIDTLNRTVSIDSNINAIELFSLEQDSMLAVERSGSYFADTGDRLDRWSDRPPSLQSNLVTLRTEREILLVHQMHKFEDGRPYAIIIMRLRPYFLQDILDAIKSQPSESLFLFNDQGNLIESDTADDAGCNEQDALEIADRFSPGVEGYTHENGNYWFFRSVSGGKLNIVQVMPDRAIMEALEGTLAGGLVIALIVATLCVIFSAVFSKLISKPIVSLADTMRNVTFEDNVDTSSHRRDEIGLLLNSFSQMQRQNKELVEREYSSRLAKRSAQLYALQSQINPHFLYNTLQVIGGMALKKNAPEIYSVTTALGDILHYSLNFTNETVTLKEELHYFESYLSIQKQRFGERLRINIDVPAGLQDALVPKLILQPILENSFQHGLPEKSKGWDIAISAGKSGEKLIIAVADNGIGIPEEKLEKIRLKLLEGSESTIRSDGHIGLANVNMRIKLREGGPPYGVRISSVQGKGTTVDLILKYRTGGSANEMDGNNNR